MIENIGATETEGGVRWTSVWLGGKNRGAESQGPQHGFCGVGINAAGAQETAYLGPVIGQVARRFGNNESRKENATAGASHVVEAAAGSEVMAAAGTAAHRGALAAVSVG